MQLTQLDWSDVGRAGSLVEYNERRLGIGVKIELGGNGAVAEGLRVAAHHEDLLEQGRQVGLHLEGQRNVGERPQRDEAHLS